MNTYCNINETMLSEVYGGNSGGAAVVAALGCAAGGVEIWETSRTMGRCNRRNWRSSGLWIFSLYRYIIKMKAKFYEGYILYYSLRFSNLSYLSIHKYLR